MENYIVPIIPTYCTIELYISKCLQYLTMYQSSLQYHSPRPIKYNTFQSSQAVYFRQLSTFQPSRSTSYSSALTLLHPSVTSSLKFADRSIAIAIPPLSKKRPIALRQLPD